MGLAIDTPPLRFSHTASCKGQRGHLCFFLQNIYHVCIRSAVVTVITSLMVTLPVKKEKTTLLSDALFQQLCFNVYLFHHVGMLVQCTTQLIKLH